MAAFDPGFSPSAATMRDVCLRHEARLRAARIDRAVRDVAAVRPTDVREILFHEGGRLNTMGHCSMCAPVLGHIRRRFAELL